MLPFHLKEKPKSSYEIFRNAVFITAATPIQKGCWGLGTLKIFRPGPAYQRDKKILLKARSRYA